MMTEAMTTTHMTREPSVQHLQHPMPQRDSDLDRKRVWYPIQIENQDKNQKKLSPKAELRTVKWSRNNTLQALAITPLTLFLSATELRCRRGNNLSQ
jgi:hypothetical protein